LTAEILAVLGTVLPVVEQTFTREGNFTNEIRVYIEISRRRSVSYVPKLRGKYETKVGISVR